MKKMAKLGLEFWYTFATNAKCNHNTTQNSKLGFEQNKLDLRF